MRSRWRFSTVVDGAMATWVTSALSLASRGRRIKRSTARRRGKRGLPASTDAPLSGPSPMKLSLVTWRALTAVLTVISLTVASTSGAATNYYRCMLYFNNPPAEESGMKAYSRVRDRPLTPDRFRHVPIRMNWNGEVERLYTNVEIRETKESTIFSYYKLPLNVLEAEEFPDPLPKRRQHKATITVTAINDRSFEITERENFTAEELTEMWESGRDLIYAGTYTKFEIRNQQCFPMEQRDFAHVDASDPNRLVETVVYNTKLCRDLQEFTDSLRLNQENDRARKILERYNVEVGVRDSFEKVPFSYIRDELLRSQLTTEAVYLALRSNNMGLVRSNKLRASPLALAQMVLANCHYQRLRVFIIDESLWWTEGGR